MEDGMEKLSLNSHAMSEGDLRILEQTLIKKVKAEEYEEAMKVANKIMAAGRGNVMTIEIHKLLQEKIKLDNDESSSEYSSSSDDSSSEEDGDSDEEKSDSTGSSASEEELDESETLWGKMDKSKPKEEVGRPKQTSTMSKEERQALKSKLMSELTELKQQSPYK
ncbi:hypothetical protein HOP50_01g06820 [Chloropicon primus]|uniref:Uncharacterized protein n=1 Tax=Chloropicon primus TaxID=1764295 RepID=A0A5B8MCP9_9CHLO|nr:hypothetical protein A3770_01p06970 [Chloropicon primus]UPQ97391.1 hypothetical protein HOP50_01g06820 [Chloropicon primus]|eukprot:QDZ18179.1 hypothetical protein A3770_01p06970 [Chloropicon primus]